MIPPSADVVGEQRIADRLRPIEQEIIVIEDVVLLFGPGQRWKTVQTIPTLVLRP
jgi:hypothetical protein